MHCSQEARLTFGVLAVGLIHCNLQGHESVNIRVAAVWAVMNLCYKTEPGHQRA